MIPLDACPSCGGAAAPEADPSAVCAVCAFLLALDAAAGGAAVTHATPDEPRVEDPSGEEH